MRDLPTKLPFILLPLLFACTQGTPAGSPPNLTGDWIGTIGVGTDLTLSLVQSLPGADSTPRHRNVSVKQGVPRVPDPDHRSVSSASGVRRAWGKRTWPSAWRSLWS